MGVGSGERDRHLARIKELEAQLEQDRAEKAVVFADAQKWWGFLHSGQCGRRDANGVFCQGQLVGCPLPLPAYLSDLSAAAKEYRDRIAREAVEAVVSGVQKLRTTRRGLYAQGYSDARSDVLDALHAALLQPPTDEVRV